MKKIICILLVSLVLSLLAACTTDPGLSFEDMENTPSTASPDTIEEETENEALENDVTKTSAYDDFKSILREKPEYTVEYEITDHQNKKEIMTIYTKEGKTRMDLISEEKYTIWMNGGAFVQYEDYCMELEAGNNFGFDAEAIHDMGTITREEFEDESDELKMVFDGAKNIAGKDVKCFQLNHLYTSGTQTTTYCLTDKGIPALIKVIDADTKKIEHEMRAVSIKDYVEDGALEPCEPSLDVTGFI